MTERTPCHQTHSLSGCYSRMQIPWQEIITLAIVGVAVWYLLKRYFFRKRPVKGAGEAACDPCSTGSCDSCAVMDLKREIDEKQRKREAKYEKRIEDEIKKRKPL
jgi:hypothetical protein